MSSTAVATSFIHFAIGPLTCFSTRSFVKGGFSSGNAPPRPPEPRRERHPVERLVHVPAQVLGRLLQDRLRQHVRARRRRKVRAQRPHDPRREPPARLQPRERRVPRLHRVRRGRRPVRPRRRERERLVEGVQRRRPVPAGRRRRRLILHVFVAYGRCLSDRRRAPCRASTGPRAAPSPPSRISPPRTAPAACTGPAAPPPASRRPRPSGPRSASCSRRQGWPAASRACTRRARARGGDARPSRRGERGKRAEGRFTAGSIRRKGARAQGSPRAARRAALDPRRPTRVGCARAPGPPRHRDVAPRAVRAGRDGLRVARRRAGGRVEERRRLHRGRRRGIRHRRGAERPAARAGQRRREGLRRRAPEGRAPRSARQRARREGRAPRQDAGARAEGPRDERRGGRDPRPRAHRQARQGGVDRVARQGRRRARRSGREPARRRVRSPRGPPRRDRRPREGARPAAREAGRQRIRDDAGSRHADRRSEGGRRAEERAHPAPALDVDLLDRRDVRDGRAPRDLLGRGLEEHPPVRHPARVDDPRSPARCTRPRRRASRCCATSASPAASRWPSGCRRRRRAARRRSATPGSAGAAGSNGASCPGTEEGPVLALLGEFGVDQFTFDDAGPLAAEVPSVEYQFLRAGGEVRLPVGPVAFELGGGYRGLLGVGETGARFRSEQRARVRRARRVRGAAAGRVRGAPLRRLHPRVLRVSRPSRATSTSRAARSTRCSARASAWPTCTERDVGSR
jgi:hypothetical protein